MRDFVRGAGITWPSGWGVLSTLQELGVELLPTNYVVGADGTILWNSHQPGRLHEVLERALVLADAKSSP